ncbi:polysulfide reductase NrfD [Eggerthellaceae bacterium zg-1084]|uniref:Polysulfide reductase NrfD n=1 Tax=Berryella wangjianweii TaxID=2734634 RepID=A0A6M8J7L6_9ACTN|nr:NrfD/PsrC family molybdoenzyme membrane anchor subunit [Berryella wangjianweii]NPD31376.1 polysulfide reductase NrfD [Berryella wangjianweii]NPD32317.1 polysulfide reductase NrfD [Eggerthellaceae bacterium zg-997]QKF06912.1 polysulfide reductase NrfD [Berryella wangjianweii]
MVWGPIIAGYLFLAGAGAGAFLASAYLDLKGYDSRWMKLGGRVLALAFLGIGLILLMIDAEAGLKNPLRFFYLVMNPASVMTIGVYCICVFMPVAFVVALLDFLRKPVPKALNYVGCAAALAVAGYTGFLLGVVNTYPLWNNTVLPVLFVLSALTAGLSSVALVGLFAERAVLAKVHEFSRFHLALAIGEAIALFALCVIVHSTSVEGAASVASMLTGQYAGLFWLGIVLVGIVVPGVVSAIEMRSANHETPAALGMSLVAEVSGLVGSFCLRLIVVLAALPLIIQ